MMPVKQYPDSILLHPCIPVDFPADIEGTLDILHYMKIVVDSHIPGASLSISPTVECY